MECTAKIEREKLNALPFANARSRATGTSPEELHMINPEGRDSVQLPARYSTYGFQFPSFSIRTMLALVGAAL